MLSGDRLPTRSVEREPLGQELTRRPLLIAHYCSPLMFFRACDDVVAAEHTLRLQKRCQNSILGVKCRSEKRVNVRGRLCLPPHLGKFNSVKSHMLTCAWGL